MRSRMVRPAIWIMLGVRGSGARNVAPLVELRGYWVDEKADPAADGYPPPDQNVLSPV